MGAESSSHGMPPLSVKGFHILRSTAKDDQYQQIIKTLIPYIGTGIRGVTGQIFRFTYTDRNVPKGKDYYYRLKIIPEEENKVASWKVFSEMT